MRERDDADRYTVLRMILVLIYVSDYFHATQRDVIGSSLLSGRPEIFGRPHAAAILSPIKAHIGGMTRAPTRPAVNCYAACI